MTDGDIVGIHLIRYYYYVSHSSFDVLISDDSIHSTVYVSIICYKAARHRHRPFVN